MVVGKSIPLKTLSTLSSPLVLSMIVGPNSLEGGDVGGGGCCCRLFWERSGCSGLFLSSSIIVVLKIDFVIAMF